MARDDFVVLIIAGVVVYFAVQWFAGKGGVLEQTTEAGAAFGKWLNLTATTIKGAQEGYPAPVVPETPEGYNPSNWTWTMPDGTKLGLPAGMTPGEFCGENPDAPVCRTIGG